MYGLVNAGILRSKNFGADLKVKGFEGLQVELCVFRRQQQGSVIIVTAIYVDDIMLLSATNKGEQQAPEDLQCGFPLAM